MNGDQLRDLQSLPLNYKIMISQQRIQEWYEYWDGQVYVSFSGGKDSTVLLHMIRELYPEVPGVFVDTGLEYPEIRDFVKGTDNVIWLKPQMNFRQVIKRHGYPVISKRQAQYIRDARTTKSEVLKTLRLTGIRKNGKYSSYSKIPDCWQYLINAPFNISEKCCDVMKKKPMDIFVKETGRFPFIGTMASDGKNRKLEYLHYGGCNFYESGRPKSTPLGFWLESDVWDYLHARNILYSPIYDMGYYRTGCMFCMFGAHLEPEPNRFLKMQVTHPKLWEYCMFRLGLKEVLDYIGVPWQNEGLWSLAELLETTITKEV